MIERIHQMNENLITEIGEYEQGCIRSYRAKSFKDDTCTTYEDEVEGFCKDKLKYLSEFKIESKMINKSLEEAATHLKRLEVEAVNLKAIEFDGKLMEFKENTANDDLGDCFLGKLEYEVIKTNLKGLNMYKCNFFIFIFLLKLKISKLAAELMAFRHRYLQKIAQKKGIYLNLIVTLPLATAGSQR
jgi:hypothetical protein